MLGCLQRQIVVALLLALSVPVGNAAEVGSHGVTDADLEPYREQIVAASEQLRCTVTFESAASITMILTKEFVVGMHASDPRGLPEGQPRHHRLYEAH